MYKGLGQGPKLRPRKNLPKASLVGGLDYYCKFQTSHHGEYNKELNSVNKRPKLLQGYSSFDYIRILRKSNGHPCQCEEVSCTCEQLEESIFRLINSSYSQQQQRTASSDHTGSSSSSQPNNMQQASYKSPVSQKTYSVAQIASINTSKAAQTRPGILRRSNNYLQTQIPYERLKISQGRVPQHKVTWEQLAYIYRQCKDVQKIAEASKLLLQAGILHVHQDTFATQVLVAMQKQTKIGNCQLPLLDVNDVVKHIIFERASGQAGNIIYVVRVWTLELEKTLQSVLNKFQLPQGTQKGLLKKIANSSGLGAAWNPEHLLNSLEALQECQEKLPGFNWIKAVTAQPRILRISSSRIRKLFNEYASDTAHSSTWAVLLTNLPSLIGIPPATLQARRTALHQMCNKLLNIDLPANFILSPRSSFIMMYRSQMMERAIHTYIDVLGIDITRKIVVSFPHALGAKQSQIKERFGELVDMFGLETAGKLVCSRAEVLAVRTRTVRVMLDTLSTICGRDMDDIKAMVAGNPQLLSYKPATLSRKLATLRTILRSRPSWSDTTETWSPTILGFCLKLGHKTYYRLKYVLWLEQQGELEGSLDVVSPQRYLRFTQAQFNTRYPKFKAWYKVQGITKFEDEV